MGHLAIRDFYERMYSVIAGTPAIVPALVPAVNVFPEDDPGQAVAGAQIVYAWTDVAWDVKAKRGTGTMRVLALGVPNKMAAYDVMEALRAVLVPRTLSGSVAGGARTVVVHMFKEQSGTADTEQDETGRFYIAGSFLAKFVGG